ncbi:MAG TPA: hypothetical protein PLK30_27705, partial [Blastocatellia bacterium]|nr:hypothetical protein [Blastocatellia bacterium]
MDKNIFLSPTEQDALRKVFTESNVSTVTDFLSDAVEKLEEGKDWTKSLLESAPWLKEAAQELGGALPIVGPAIKAITKLIEKGLAPSFNELAAMACTLAYQAAVRDALTAEKSFSVDQYRAKQKIDSKVARQIRNASPA